MTERVKILEGERVALALIEKEDSLLRYRHMNDLEVQQFLSVGGCLLYKEAEQDYYDHIIKNPNMRALRAKRISETFLLKSTEKTGMPNLESQFSTKTIGLKAMEQKVFSSSSSMLLKSSDFTKYI